MAGARPSRLSRLLALVPYFLARRGISLEQAARDLGVTPAQLTKDLEQLFVCGLPGYYPDDLIELEFYEGHVNVGFTAGMDRPLRLTTTEASILLVALRALVDMPGVVDRSAARRAIAKIEQAVGTTIARVVGVSDAEPDTVPDNPTYAAVRAAVRNGRALALRYYSASRDTITERVVDPIRLQVVDTNTYLDAWCRSSEDVRLFRFDRIEAAVVLDEPSAPPDDAARTSQSAILRDNPDLPTADVEIDPTQVWIFDYYSIEPLDEPPAGPDGSAPLRGRLVYGSPDWLLRFLLGYGGRVRITGNESVADAVVATATAARARYRVNTSA
ncbi:MAG: YafY family protein [Gordonia sp. (in: high G+C Gram-positive bacteria)]